ncbi:hypothetical protein BDD14_1622 [Edaphobacter modestus]|uniref:Uncharacterized protein n=1 Tax=Edaphobacter modestus TaxID=388466 RepID=A0A4Q7YT76_9BACT|nr:hypothetical protein BDD14_1622 [Edaphobacter modestus]
MQTATLHLSDPICALTQPYGLPKFFQTGHKPGDTLSASQWSTLNPKQKRTDPDGSVFSFSTPPTRTSGSNVASMTAWTALLH